jgi:hypothetical protein
MPLTVAVPAVVLVKETLLKVTPTFDPAAIVGLVAVKTILEVPALNVRFVFVIKLIAPLAALNVTVLLPRLIVRVLLLLDDRDVAVTLKLLVVKVQAVTVIVLVQVSASAKTYSEVAVLIPMLKEQGIDFPFVVILKVPEGALKNNVVASVHVIAAETVRPPSIMMFVLPAKVPVKPVKLRLRQLAVAVWTVQVTAPDAASKKTSSDVVGTACPPAPPEVKAHLVPAVPSQDAVPPTQ